MSMIIVLIHQNNTEKEKSTSVELFTDLIRSIKRCQSKLLKKMEEQQKAAEKQAEDLIKELQQEITDLKKRNTELEQLSHTDDHLHLYRSVSISLITENVHVDFAIFLRANICCVLHGKMASLCVWLTIWCLVWCQVCLFYFV